MFKNKYEFNSHFWRNYFTVYDYLTLLIPYNNSLETMIDKANFELDHSYNILDIGCGTGNLIFKLMTLNKQKFFFNVTGIDASNDALSIARKKLSNFENNVNLVNLDLSDNLQLQNNYFDVIFVHNVLYTLDRNLTNKILEDVYKSLKPGGKFIISELNCNFKPINIYLDHIKRSVTINGFVKTLISIIKFIVPTIRIFYYNRIIKKTSKNRIYNFFKSGELKDILSLYNFHIIISDQLNYSNSAYLILAKK